MKSMKEGLLLNVVAPARNGLHVSGTRRHGSFYLAAARPFTVIEAALVLRKALHAATA